MKLHVVNGERPRPADRYIPSEYERACSAMLHRWTQAVTRNAVLSGKLPRSCMGPNPFERPKA